MALNLDDIEQVWPALSVGLLTWALPPVTSGLSRAALEIAHAVAATGAHVRVFTLDRQTRERDGDVEIIGCAIPEGSSRAWWRKRAAIGHLMAPLAFRRAVRTEHGRRPFDVIEATNWYAPGALVAAFGPAPLVTRNSTPAAISSSERPALRDRLDHAFARWLERGSARRSAALISNTTAHGRTIAALYAVTEPGPGHATIGLSLPETISRRGRAASYPGGDIVELLFVGRNETRKGFDAVIGAFVMLAAEADQGRIAPFRLTIVGAGPADVLDLPDTARTRLRCLQRIDEAGLHDLFERAHVVVAPSRYESFGLVYQEALIFGRPIVACAEDDSARLFVGDSGAGILAVSCSGPAVADALRPMIDDPALRARYSEASRAAGGRFTRSTLGRETVAVYRAAMASNGRSSSASSSRRAPSGDMSA